MGVRVKAKRLTIQSDTEAHFVEAREKRAVES